jgi:hypothetical protein
VQDRDGFDLLIVELPRDPETSDHLFELCCSDVSPGVPLICICRESGDLVLLAVRFYGQGLLRQILWTDDWIMLAAMVCTRSSCSRIRSTGS